jgi:hypothetical protein
VIHSFQKLKIILISCNVLLIVYHSNVISIFRQKCDRCSFETTCIRAYWKHIHLSDCDPENKQRFELAVTKDENFIPPKCSFKIRKNLEITKSKDYIQNFRMFRDFSYDRKPTVIPQTQEKTEINLIKERREKLKNMTTARRTNDIPSYILDGIAESLFAEDKEDEDTMKFIKGIRVPFMSLCEEFLAEKKRKEEEDIEMLDESSEIDKPLTEPAPLEDEDVVVEMSESTQVVEDTPSIQIDEIVEENVVELIEKEKIVEESEIMEEKVVEQTEEKVVEREEEQISTIQEEEEMDQEPSPAAPSSSTPSAISA